MSTRKEKISGYNIYCKILPIPLLVSIFRSNPSGTSVIKHDRENGRQFPGRGNRFLLDQVLVEESHVGQHPQPHPGVATRLEFDQDIDIEPPGSPANLPHNIIGAFFQVLADERGFDLGKRPEIELANPVLPDETPKEVFHHVRVRKEVDERRVKTPHTPILSQPAVPSQDR